MNTRPLTDPAPGEFLLAVAPRPVDGEVAGWRRRINGFAGRALAADALAREQDQRAGRLALLAQALSPGVVDGLGVVLDGATLHLTPGLGLSAYGEDVRLTRAVALNPVALPVYESDAPPADAPPDTLRPRRLGRTLAEHRAQNLPLPPALILLLVPATFDTARRGDPANPCEYNPEDDAFLDLTRIDAARLALYPWPTDALALPAPGARWRNRLAQAIFLAEKDLGPDDLAPWQAAGVPLALLGFDAAASAADAVLLFADAHAVQRPGGRPLARATLRPDAPHPYLCEARMRQFADHLNDALAVAAGVAEAAAEFIHLPPAGLLPREALDIANEAQRFFPPGFVVDAVPLPLEQLDTALADAATLASLSSDRAERVQMLVPVPQTVYEPGLLTREEIDGEFAVALDGFVTRRGVELARRNTVRERLSVLARAVDGKPLDFPDPDPQALEPETETELPLEPAEADYGTATDAAGARVASALTAYAARLEAGPVKAQFARAGVTVALAEIGLVRYLAELRVLADEADDSLSFGYARARLDLRRARDVLDPEGGIADQLLASDAGNALIAKQRNPVTAKHYADAQAALRKRDVPAPSGPTAPTAPTAPASPGIAGPIAASTSFIASRVAGTAFGGADFSTLDFGERARANSASSVRDRAGLIQRPSKALQDFNVNALFVDTEVARTVVAPFSLDTQIARPPAVSTFDQAKSGRSDAVNAIAGLQLNLGGLQFFGLADAANNNQPFDLGTLRGRRNDALGAASKYLPAETTESGHLTSALLGIDQSLAVWRQVGARVAQYREAIADGERALAVLRSQVRAASARLSEIDADLAEARHDVALARALIAEETARIDAVNARRARVLAEDVRFLAFRRVRVAEVIDSLPERALDPAFTVDPVPACRNASAAPPAEVEAMLDVIRRAPPAWFPAVARALSGIGRIEQLGHLLDFARVQSVAPARITPGQIDTSRLAIARGSTVRIGTTELVAASLARIAARPRLTLVSQASWTDARNSAAEHATLGDVIAAGGKAAARTASEALDAFGDLGACLYRGFSATPASLRLAWAEALSQFDDAEDLAQLARLSGFSGVDFTLRRTLQTLVDALFARVDPTRPEARALMSDFVRVCLLTAAHAPVKRIVAGRTLRPAPATPGMRIPLALDPARVRVGMKVNFYAGSAVVAQGVLDDLDASGGAARITHNFAGSTVLAANTLAQLLD